MTPEQRKEFKKIIMEHYNWAGSVDDHVCFKAMKAAHNAAVRKCADSDIRDYDPNSIRKSILQNRIEP